MANQQHELAVVAMASSLFWPLCCLFFLDIRILITPLVSSLTIISIKSLKVLWISVNLYG
jgi:hypothetical protein